MAALQRFQCFVEDIAHGAHRLNTDVLKMALSNTRPSVITASRLAHIVEIATGNGYSAGGETAGQVSSGQADGLYALILSDVSFVAGPGIMGPFQYAVLYNSTGSNGPLIGYWDYGSELTLQPNDTFIVDLSQAEGALRLQ